MGSWIRSHFSYAVLSGLCHSVCSHLSTPTPNNVTYCSGFKSHLSADDFQIYISNLDPTLRLQSLPIWCGCTKNTYSSARHKHNSYLCLHTLLSPPNGTTGDLIAQIWTLNSDLQGSLLLSWNTSLTCFQALSHPSGSPLPLQSLNVGRSQGSAFSFLLFSIDIRPTGNVIRS